jgi:hypothetical protein
MIQWEASVDSQKERDRMHLIGQNLAAMSSEDEKAAYILWKQLEGPRASLSKEHTTDERER